MPALSMFYGVVIYMFFFERTQPHLHASCGEEDAVYSIEDGELLEGNLPVDKHRLVQAWIEMHRCDLLTNWRLAVTGQPPLPIKALG